MQSIQEKLVSPYRGSEKTYELVRKQVRERYGDECAESFDPSCDAMPFVCWANYGYRVKRGEKAFRSVTVIEMKNDKGEVQMRYPRSVLLFHKKQVEKVV